MVTQKFPRSTFTGAIVSILLIAATPALAAVEYVIEISVDGLGGPQLKKIFGSSD